MTEFSRRDVIRLTGAAASIAAFSADSPRRRPNIVFVLLDDLVLVVSRASRTVRLGER
jgi:hypothetical protein